MTKKLIFLINKFRKGSYFIFVCALIGGAILETFSIAAIYPFMKLVVDKNSFYMMIETFPLLKNMEYDNFINLSLLVIFFIYLIKLLYLCCLNYIQTKFVADIEITSAEKLYNLFIKKKYEDMVDKNSGFETSNIINDSVAFGKAVLVFTTIIIEATILFFVAIMITVLIDPKTIFFLLFFVLLSYIVHTSFKGVFQKWGTQKRIFHGERLGVLQESMVSYKIIKIMGLESFFLKKFIPINMNSVDVIRKQNFAIGLPKIFYEFLAILSFLFLFYFMRSGHSTEEIIPALAILAATAFRVLPAFSRLFQGLQGLKYFKNSIESIYDLVQKEKSFIEKNLSKINDKPIFFEHSIDLKNIFFKYQEKDKDKDKKIFHDMNISIKKNEILGVLGKSGAGKSTFLDILCGLLKFQSGKFLVDGVEIDPSKNLWKSKFGYVQQNTMIFDNSFKNNIILDSEYDESFFYKVINMTKLDIFANKLQNSIDTNLGEAGSKISGGEMQRIGIARALYKRPSILIMDEPTSALDADTENAFLNNLQLYEKEITIIIISHKLNTLKYCNKIVEIIDNRIILAK